jgi:hypothetical protein
MEEWLALDFVEVMRMVNLLVSIVQQSKDELQLMGMVVFDFD